MFIVGGGLQSVPKCGTVVRMDIHANLARTAEETLSGLASLGTVQLRLPKTAKFSRADVVNAFSSAFELIGGTTRLALWANENPGEFYKLFGKLLPSSSQVELVGRPTSDDDLKKYTTQELRQMYQEALEAERASKDSNVVDVDFRMR